jgi:hypothetical protein
VVPLTLPCVPPSFELFACLDFGPCPVFLFLSLFLGALFFLVKGWQGFIIYKCARNNVSNLSTILFMWSVSRRRRRRRRRLGCVYMFVCFWLVGGNCISWWICCTMSKYGYRKILERNISLQECLVPAASFFEPSKAFYILGAMNNGKGRFGSMGWCRNRYRAWNNIINGFMSDTS